MVYKKKNMNKVFFIIALAIYLCLPAKVYAQLDFPSGTGIVLDGSINTVTSEWADAAHLTITVNSQPADCWYKFDPAVNRMLFGFRVQDNTGPPTQDQITIFFDNVNDGSAPPNYGYGQRRNGQLREYINAIIGTHNSAWNAAVNDSGTFYEMEFSIRLFSVNFLFDPGFNPNGPGILIEVQDNAILDYYPLTGGPPDAYGAYEATYSSYWWLSSPPPTRTITPTIAPTATPTPTPLGGGLLPFPPGAGGEVESVVYPNPARGSTVNFVFYSDEDTTASIQIFNAALRLVEEIKAPVAGQQVNQVSWNISDVAPGIYLYQIRVGAKKIRIQKLAIIK